MSLLALGGGFLVAATLIAAASPASAQELRAPREADWVARDFHFRDGEVAPALRLHYTTLGDPKGEPVLVLHGTGGSGASMLAAGFADELFGPGQPLDAATHFIILPDSIGAGKSAKPSDGLKASFPRYGYQDMVEAQYRLVTEDLGLRHLRLVLGNSMGGMHAWLWATKYPGFADAVVPLASLPAEVSGRNWMMRRLLIEAIRNDPDWNHGDYAAPPRGLKIALQLFGVATNGGTLAYQDQAPTRAAADKLIDDRLAAPFAIDANDLLYQYEASRDYNPGPDLERIRASVLAINSLDDERNPPETGVLEREIQRVKAAKHYWIPASAQTRGHSTTMIAKLWKERLAELLATAPRL